MNVQHSIHIPSFLKVYDNALDDLGSILQNSLGVIAKFVLQC